MSTQVKVVVEHGLAWLVVDCPACARAAAPLEPPATLEELITAGYHRCEPPKVKPKRKPAGHR